MRAESEPLRAEQDRRDAAEARLPDEATDNSPDSSAQSVQEPVDQIEAPPAEPSVEVSAIGSDVSDQAQADNQAALLAAMQGWTSMLQDIQRSIDAAATAIHLLRETLAQMGPVFRSLGGLEESLSSFGEKTSPSYAEKPRLRAIERPRESDAATGPDTAEEPLSTAQSGPEGEEEEDEPAAPSWQAWKRRQRERASPRPTERDEAAPEVVSIGPRPQAMKPVTLVPGDTPAPYSYRLSIEDRKRPLELVSLYQALNTVPSIKNLSLLGYVNGVASITVEATDEVKPEEIEAAVTKVMKRNCSVVPHESDTILVQLDV